MPSKLVVALVIALCAFFGVMAVASAATPASTAYAHVAQVGTWAAVDGAPFCDDRAASEPAAEPTPREVDGGTVAPHADAPCRSDAWKKGPAPTPQRDDLQRTPPAERIVALVPQLALDAISSPACAGAFERGVGDGARDGFDRRDNPPPRPIPWARAR
ncbi:MAG: hypothetical protein NVSMB47_13640 [Polyangiales bacterium]